MNKPTEPKPKKQGKKFLFKRQDAVAEIVVDENYQKTNSKDHEIAHESNSNNLDQLVK